MVNLPDVLVGTLFVLSLLPSPFTLELFEPLLALAQTKTGKHSVLRRLVNLGLLSYNASLQQYSMHKVVREAARLLAHNLGECREFSFCFQRTQQCCCPVHPSIWSQPAALPVERVDQRLSERIGILC
jgi:hypothetical protein